MLTRLSESTGMKRDVRARLMCHKHLGELCFLLPAKGAIE